MSTKNAPPPKCNGVYSKYCANISEIFTTEFSMYLYTVWRNSWKFNVKVVFDYAFNYLSKTQVSMITRTHAHSQLTPKKQCDYSSTVKTCNKIRSFSWQRTLITTRSLVLNTILSIFVLLMRQLHQCWRQLTPWTVSKKACYWKL